MCTTVGTTETWPLVPPEDPEGWRHIRVKLTGPNSSGQSHYLSVSGLELYGEIRGLADEELGQFVHADSGNLLHTCTLYIHTCICT